MSKTKLATATGRPPAVVPSPFIVSPIYDCVFFLLPPTVALCLGILIADSGFANRYFAFYDQDVTWSGLLIGIFIHAHLFAVFFRSHGNTAIRRLHPYRFLLVPVALYAAMVSSLWVLISVSVLATFWDVYHSALQTFGFARIYDRKAGNDPAVGRRLDWHVNQLLYAGPILAGATMMDHVEDFGEYEEVGATFFTSIPGFMEANQGYFAWSVLTSGAAFLAYYLWAQVRLARQGHEISFQKVYLLVSTGAVSIYTWGFNSFGEAFFIMNFFHALQYFGIVWAFEKRNMMKLFHTERLSLGKPLTAVIFVGLAGAYGFWVESLDPTIEALWAITLIVSIMHFWYDGFVWSVRKHQV
jgi:hypothetical protein